MRILIMLFLFAGMAIVIHSIYEEKLQRIQKHAKVEYRFLPRTLYDEQIDQGGTMTEDNQRMFARRTPWP